MESPKGLILKKEKHHRTLSQRLVRLSLHLFYFQNTSVWVCTGRCQRCKRAGVHAQDADTEFLLHSVGLFGFF